MTFLNPDPTVTLQMNLALSVSFGSMATLVHNGCSVPFVPPVPVLQELQELVEPKELSCNLVNMGFILTFRKQNECTLAC